MSSDRAAAAHSSAWRAALPRGHGAPSASSGQGAEAAPSNPGERIATALRACAVDFTTPGAAAVTASVEGSWLCLRAEVAGGAPSWAALEWNATLPGGAKLALDPRSAELVLLAEIPADDDVDLAVRLRQACAGLSRGAAILRHGGLAPELCSSQGHGDAEPLDLPALCRAASYAAHERADGSAAVALEARRVPRHALVRQRPCGSIAASVDLDGDPVDDDGPPPVCRDAMARLLLRTSGVLRLARAAVAGGAPRLEVVFDDAPSPAELRHALVSLAVGCELAAREAEVLARDEGAARAYLERTLGPPLRVP